jgi:hypothetical protein
MQPLIVRRIVLWIVVAWVGAIAVHAQKNSDRADWMREARLGVMTHFLHDWIIRGLPREQLTPENWNKLVDGFDVEKCAEQLHSIGAGYYIISIGQNSGYYLSPSSAYDRITGIKPSKLSRRDLVADLAAALGKRGIRLIVYLPAGAPAGDREAREKLQWQNGPYRNLEFQLHWEEIIREWSVRWGDKIAGWWYDGCYWPNQMYRTDEEPNFKSFAAASRAGNPKSAVAFNPGVVNRTLSITPHEDYIASEVSDPKLWNARRNFDGRIDGAQLFFLSYLGETWGRGAPRFTDEQAVALTKPVAAAGSAITWDTPTEKNGTFRPEYLAQLKAISEAIKATPMTTTETAAVPNRPARP